MAGFHDLFCYTVVQHGGLCALLHEHQVFNVALGSLDGRKVQARGGKVVRHGIPLGHFQYLAVGSRVAHDALFADLLAPGLKLRLNQAGDLAPLAQQRIERREDELQ